MSSAAEFRATPYGAEIGHRWAGPNDRHIGETASSHNYPDTVSNSPVIYSWFIKPRQYFWYHSNDCAGVVGGHTADRCCGSDLRDDAYLCALVNDRRDFHLCFAITVGSVDLLRTVGVDWPVSVPDLRMLLRRPAARRQSATG